MLVVEDAGASDAAGALRSPAVPPALPPVGTRFSGGTAFGSAVPPWRDVSGARPVDVAALTVCPSACPRASAPRGAGGASPVWANGLALVGAGASAATRTSATVVRSPGVCVLCVRVIDGVGGGAIGATLLGASWGTALRASAISTVPACSWGGVDLVPVSTPPLTSAVAGRPPANGAALAVSGAPRSGTAGSSVMCSAAPAGARPARREASARIRAIASSPAWFEGVWVAGSCMGGATVAVPAAPAVRALPRVPAPAPAVAPAVAWTALRFADVPVGQPVPDDLERQEVLALLAQDPAQTLDVGFEEFPIARRGTLRVHQALALEESDLRNRDVGEFLAQQRQHVPDGQIRTRRHSFPATR